MFQDCAQAQQRGWPVVRFRGRQGIRKCSGALTELRLEGPSLGVHSGAGHLGKTRQGDQLGGCARHWKSSGDGTRRRVIRLSGRGAGCPGQPELHSRSCVTVVSTLPSPQFCLLQSSFFLPPSNVPSFHSVVPRSPSTPS